MAVETKVKLFYRIIGTSLASEITKLKHIKIKYNIR